MDTIASIDERFGTTSSYTVGVEEEFQLVDPSTLELAPAIEEVIGAIADGSERLARELCFSPLWTPADVP